MATIEIAEVSSSDGRGDDLEAAMNATIELIAAQPGVSRCAAIRGIEEPSAFVFLIEWDSVEAHMAFRDSAAFGRYQALVEGLIAGDTRIAHYRPVAGARGGRP